MSHIHPDHWRRPPDPAPETTGRTIHWANFYDGVVKLLALGKDRDLRRKTIELAQIQAGEQILDVGCGTGDLTLLAAPAAGAAGRVVGIDASPEMIQVARQKAARSGSPVEFRTEPIERLSFAAGSFDLVLSSLMFHHLPGDLKRAGLAEVKRVLKPGGRLLIVDFIRPSSNVGRWRSFLLLHGMMSDAPDLLPGFLTELGFTNLRRGNVKFGTVGFVSSQLPG